MSKVDDELTRRLQRAERPVDGDDLFEALARRRSHRDRLRKVRAGMLAFAVLAATAGGFVALRSAFQLPSRGPATDPGLAPPNGLIVFSRVGDDGRSHLFTARPDGTGVEQLTHGATNDIDAAISPDGRWITLVRSVGDSSTDVGTVPFDDPDVEPVEPRFSSLMSPEPAWSADSSMIAVREGNAAEPSGTALLIVPLDGDSSAAHLAGRGGDLAHPSWGPGSRIVFAILGAAGDRETGWDLATVSSNGAGYQSLVAEPGDQTTPTWSFDGSRIAYLQPGDGGHEIWTIAPDGTDKTLIATAVGASLEPDLAWAPDGSSLLVSDGEWIYRVDPTPQGDPDADLEKLVRGHSPAWQPLPPGSDPTTTASAEPSLSPSPSPVLEDSDIGLGFNVCDLAVLGGIDFLGDGTDGTAWTLSQVEPNGKCPSTSDGTNGVAVDFTGDGDADSWSKTIEHCTMCGPFMARDLNEDGTEEVIVTLQGGSIMQYGIYTVLPVDGRLQVVPLRTGEPGHDDAGHAVGQPFTFWVGGDEGSSYWFQCEALPEFRLTHTYTPVDGAPDAETTVHETHVSLGTDGIADILDAQTYTVIGEVDLQYATSKPDCGLGVDIWRLQAPA